MAAALGAYPLSDPRSGLTTVAGPVAGQPTGAQAQERDHGWGPCAPAGARPAPPARVVKPLLANRSCQGQRAAAWGVPGSGGANNEHYGV